jgi:hypothetical protein
VNGAFVDCRPYKKCRFAYDLRRSLWREVRGPSVQSRVRVHAVAPWRERWLTVESIQHLGLFEHEMDNIDDPVCEATFKYASSPTPVVRACAVPYHSLLRA